MATTPVLLPEKSHGRRSLVGCSPWGRQESDMTERLHFHFSLSCFGEGNGNPLQCSCLENPSDGGAWWAAVYGVAQSRTRLKQLSSSMFNSLLLNDQLLEKKTYLIHLHTLRTEQTLAESVHNYHGHGNQISNLLELFCNQDNEVYDFLCTVLFFFLFFFYHFFFFICGGFCHTLK